jgi:hypothetical protein
MTMRVYYTSADAQGAKATWSVYSELYLSSESPEPVDGSQVLVEAGMDSEQEADLYAKALQRSENWPKPWAEQLELTALKDQVAVANQILPERERQVSDLREELQQAIWAANRLRRELREVTAERDHLRDRLDAIAAVVAKYDERNGE